MVFTVPAEAADIAVYNKAAVIGLLFRVTSETMLAIAIAIAIAADRHYLGARIGITAVLPPGLAMTHYPHFDVIVPGAGIADFLLRLAWSQSCSGGCDWSTCNSCARKSLERREVVTSCTEAAIQPIAAE